MRHDEALDPVGKRELKRARGGYNSIPERMEAVDKMIESIHSIVGGSSSYIQRKLHDIHVVPDKFNTGPQISLTTSSGAGSYGDIVLIDSSGDTKLAIDGYNSMFNLVDLVCEGFDFSSDKDILVTNSVQLSGRRTILFRNCKLNNIASERAMDNLWLVFINCEITGVIEHSNIETINCKHGGTEYDCVKPLKNFFSKNCFYQDMSFPTSLIDYHADCIQTTGYGGYTVENIVMENFRMEIPKLKYSHDNNGSYVNAGLMIQLELSNGRNMIFKNGRINGGGYPIYALSTNDQYDLHNVLFKDIKLGCAAQHGGIYDVKISKGAIFDNITDEEYLMVSTVTKDESGNVTVTVTNDTNEEKTLLIVTEQEVQEISVPACPTYDEFVADTMTYDDFPFDIQHVINANDPGYIICYDGEISESNRVRFESFDGLPVKL